MLECFRTSHGQDVPSFAYARRQLCNTAALLERKVSIPQVKAKLSVLQEVQTDAFWEASEIFAFEQVRKELRELIKFLDEGGDSQRRIFTKLADPILEQRSRYAGVFQIHQR